MAEKRILEREESRKRMERGDGRRDKFKGRARDLQRGVSAPVLVVEGRKKEAPKAPLPLSEMEAITVGQGLGHDFVRKTFFQPTHCHYCTELLWGIRGQGLQCEVCNFVSHEKCIPSLKSPCRHVLADRIQDPVEHRWISRTSFKKKVHCNVCRKKINSKGAICEVCKYYAHDSCIGNAFNNCKHCATYIQGATHRDMHHWIEGNLPGSARCQVCTKSCCTSDCLSGFRCGWCGISVHSSCLDTISSTQPQCTYRDLWSMIIVPRAITMRYSIRSEADPATPTGIDDPEAECLQVEDEDAADGNGTDSGKGKPCVVVDGSGKSGFKRWRKATVQPVYIKPDLTAAELLSISLRKCGISDDPCEYFLAEMLDAAKGEERALKAAEHPHNIPSKGYGPLKLYIRHKDTTKLEAEVQGNMRINNSQLDSEIRQVVVPVSMATTSAKIVAEALVKFDILGEEAGQFCLVEVSQVSGVRERVLNDIDCPWRQLYDLRRASLTLCSRQRYYLRHREGGPTALHISSVPKELLREEAKYTEFIKQLLSEAPPELLPSPIPYSAITIGPAFPAMGGLVLNLPTFELAMKISAALEEAASKPKVSMLPTIYPDVIGRDQEPMLVFINGKSGGNQGVELVSAFRRHLNPHQVYDLSKGGPMPGLYAFRQVPQFRILIGGGDGTFGWVLSALEEARGFLNCENPPCALLPLGTGNDLARALNWGGGYTGGEKVMQILRTVEDADVVDLDRWEVEFHEDPLANPILEPHSVVMNNYMGLGLDAAIALDFHLAREENPEKFSSRFRNKSTYLTLGLQKMVSKDTTSELNKHIKIQVDGKVLELPDVEGVIFLNIQSWGAGADAWGSTQEAGFQTAAYDDGVLEVVGISGVVHMGQVQSGIRNAIRLAQGKKFRIDILNTLPVQVDGEAWPQPAGFLTLSALPQQAAMLAGSKEQFFSKQLSKKATVAQMAVGKVLVGKALSEPELLSGGISSRRRPGRTSGGAEPQLQEEDEEDDD